MLQTTPGFAEKSCVSDRACQVQEKTSEALVAVQAQDHVALLLISMVSMQISFRARVPHGRHSIGTGWQKRPSRMVRRAQAGNLLEQRQRRSTQATPRLVLLLVTSPRVVPARPQASTDSQETPFQARQLAVVGCYRARHLIELELPKIMRWHHSWTCSR